MQTIEPLYDCVLVQREEQTDRTPGGIFIPDTAKEKLNRGTVLAVGRGKVLDSGKLREPTVKAGEVVVFLKTAGQEVDVGDKKALLLREEQILGIVRNGS
jgi:chaperonin GroES